jgi:hypothetical protein
MLVHDQTSSLMLGGEDLPHGNAKSTSIHHFSERKMVKFVALESFDSGSIRPEMTCWNTLMISLVRRVIADPRICVTI